MAGLEILWMEVVYDELFSDRCSVQCLTWIGCPGGDVMQEYQWIVRVYFCLKSFYDQDLFGGPSDALQLCG